MKHLSVSPIWEPLKVVAALFPGQNSVWLVTVMALCVGILIVVVALPYTGVRDHPNQRPLDHVTSKWLSWLETASNVDDNGDHGKDGRFWGLGEWGFGGKIGACKHTCADRQIFLSFMFAASSHLH